MDDFVLDFWQIAQFPSIAEALPTDLILVQRDLGGNNFAVSALGLLQGPLSDPNFNWEIGGSIAIGGSISVNGNATVFGEVFTNALSVNGPADITGDLSIGGSVNAVQGLSTEGNLTVGGGALIQGQLGLTVLFDSSFGGNVIIDGGATVGGFPVATRNWVEQFIQDLLTEDFEVGDVFGFLRLSGGIMDGPLILVGPAPANQPNQAVTRAQLDNFYNSLTNLITTNEGLAWVGPLPPDNALPGRLWMNSNNWQLFVNIGQEGSPVWCIAVNWSTAPVAQTSWDTPGQQWDVTGQTWDQ